MLFTICLHVCKLYVVNFNLVHVCTATPYSTGFNQIWNNIEVVTCLGNVDGLVHYWLLTMMEMGHGLATINSNYFAVYGQDHKVWVLFF